MEKGASAMTSEAKIGLLLGLVFIFLIAFIINGIPLLHKDTNNNKLSNNMVSLENTPPGLAAKERRIRQAFESTEPVAQKQPTSQPQAEVNNSPAATVLSSTPSIPVATNPSETTKAVSVQPLAASVEETENKVDSTAASTELGRTSSPQVKPSESASQAVYIVTEGDSLGSIAKKVYGSQHGNEKNNTTRIFQANRNVLQSPDEIYIGQKLVIPLLADSQPDKNKLEKLSRPTLLEKVKSIGQKNVTTDLSRPEGNRSYTVQEGDSLWQIATKQLGDGNRYEEIVELNADILESEDNLAVGMSLKLPKR